LSDTGPAWPPPEQPGPPETPRGDPSTWYYPPGSRPPTGTNGPGGVGGPPPPAPRRAPALNGRRTLWIAIFVGAVILLSRSHKITSDEIILFCVLVPSIILHEIAHGWVALACGDDTAKRAGRLTLNPLAHIDPIGTIILPVILVLSGFGWFGYAKPVPVNVGRLRSPRNQGVLVSLAGPATNVVLAALAAVVFHLSHGAANFDLWARILFSSTSGWPRSTCSPSRPSTGPSSSSASCRPRGGPATCTCAATRSRSSCSWSWSGAT
jgi:hypothetical protein